MQQRTMLRAARPQLHLHLRHLSQLRHARPNSTAPSASSSKPSSNFPLPLLTALTRTLLAAPEQLSAPTSHLLERVARLLETCPTTAQLILPQHVEDALTQALAPKIWPRKRTAAGPEPEREHIIPLPNPPTRPPLTRKQRASLRRLLHRLSWPPTESAPNLPAHKLQLLVQLAHSTRAFPNPSPEGLNQAIDDALVPDFFLTRGRMMSAWELVKRAGERANLPELAIPGRGAAARALNKNVVDAVFFPGTQMDLSERGMIGSIGRSAKVLEAITGVDWVPKDDQNRPAPLPLLPAVRDAEGTEQSPLAWDKSKTMHGASGVPLRVTLKGDRPLYRQEKEPPQAPVQDPKRKGWAWF
ncbi:hypothetical protein CALVIDRAFT_260350 [Calocera viscosa TUFC12733]|uniref:Uncharacterized protein n=1 Tax=Calocera viscosa (strain TUFC12733) TaxID=1330018 RepID=A0A167J3B8_CALVF|nr:hypothetical protein CALVIDRAFT_260350 [Calocera viscosa TUFC12733]